MPSKPKWIRIAQLSVVLLCAAALKLYYSTTGVNGLLWILAPTAKFVELISGTRFEFESHAGYMSSDHTFLIAASCSGINFLIAGFLMLSLGKLWRDRSLGTGWKFIPAAALTAYLATIVANTVRISVALWLRKIDRETIWLNPDQLHRFEGIFIYFGFLLLLFIVSERVSSVNVSRSKSASVLIRRSFLPLLVYYAVTLAVPLANGAYRGGTSPAGFWEYSLFAFFIPIFLILLLATLYHIKYWCAAVRRRTLC